jgi:photosystem II stability/assembly factor-like uncharacterized protein
MNELEIDALDRDLDLLTRAGGSSIITSAPDRPAVLELLAMVRAADWPDRAAGKRITQAVAAQLCARGTRDAGPAATADWWSRMTADRGSGVEEHGRRPPRGHHRLTARRSVALVSAAAVALAGMITAATAIYGAKAAPSSPAAPAQVYHSRFAAAVLPGHSQSAGPGRILAGGWQLLSYVTTPGWHANDIGTPPLTLSCPTITVCYMIAARPVPVSGWGYQTTPRFNLLEVSRDGGGSWTTLSLPSDVSIITALQCPASATACYAAGYDAGRVALLATEDGGLSWSARPVPGSVTGAATLTCTSDGSCVGLFEAGGWAPGYDRQAPAAKVLVTRDGGFTWSPGPPTPRGQLPDYLACADATCVLFDQLITLDNSQSVNGSGPLTVAPGSWTAWYSDDSGATWQRGRHPGGIWTMASHDLPESGTISCSDHLHCQAAMSSQQISQPGIATAFAATSDGGASWVTRPLPADRARQFIPQGMSCPTAMRCYAAGGDSSGPVILTTRDGGSVWSSVNLPRTSARSAPNGSTAASIGPIACAAAGHCVAAPENTDSAHRVPIYVLRSPAALP